MTSVIENIDELPVIPLRRTGERARPKPITGDPDFVAAMSCRGPVFQLVTQLDGVVLSRAVIESEVRPGLRVHVWGTDQKVYLLMQQGRRFVHYTIFEGTFRAAVEHVERRHRISRELPLRQRRGVAEDAA